MAKRLETRDVRASVINIVVLAVIFVLSITMMSSLSRAVKETSTATLSKVTKAQLRTISSTFGDAEDRLADFSKSSAVKNILLDAKNEAYVTEAQDYTTAFAADIKNLEGLYICTWDTKVLAHSNPSAVGSATREGEDADALKESITAKPDAVYNAGIINSPVTNAPVFSAYKAVIDNGKPIGYVGIAIDAEKAVLAVEDPDIKYVKDWRYAFINTATNTYVSDTNGELTGKPVDNEAVRNAIAAREDTTVSYDKMTSGYAQDPIYNIALMLETQNGQLFFVNGQITSFAIVLGVILLIIAIGTTIITRKHEASRLNYNREHIKNENITRSLNEAVMLDMLTDTKNRNAFAIDAEKIHAANNQIIMLGMVSIASLNDINITYGNNTGDTVIAKTAKYCMEAFPDADVYRTGSGEFMIAMLSDDTPIATNNFVSRLTALQQTLNAPHSTPAGSIPFPCLAIAARKHGTINSSVITIMKNAIKHPMPGTGSFQLIDIDTAA